MRVGSRYVVRGGGWRICLTGEVDERSRRLGTLFGRKEGRRGGRHVEHAYGRRGRGRTLKRGQVDRRCGRRRRLRARRRRRATAVLGCAALRRGRSAPLATAAMMRMVVVRVQSPSDRSPRRMFAHVRDRSRRVMQRILGCAFLPQLGDEPLALIRFLVVGQVGRRSRVL